MKFSTQFKYAEFNGTVYLTCCRLRIHFLGKFGPENQNCQFKLNSNIQNLMGCSLFLVLILNTVFGYSNLISRLIQICRIQWWCSLHLFQTGNTLFGPKNENCQFQVKFGTKSDSDMKNSMMMFILYVSERKYHFCGKFVSKNQNCLLKQKLEAQTTSDIQNSMVVFILFFCIMKIPFLD